MAANLSGYWQMSSLTSKLNAKNILFERKLLSVYNVETKRAEELKSENESLSQRACSLDSQKVLDVRRLSFEKIFAASLVRPLLTSLRRNKKEGVKVVGRK